MVTTIEEPSTEKEEEEEEELDARVRMMSHLKPAEEENPRARSPSRHQKSKSRGGYVEAGRIREAPQYRADPNKKVTGTFFDRGPDKPYFGAHPISFAVCLKRPEKKEIIRLLLENGAVLFGTDKFKNNLLHLCVYHEDVEMYNYISDLFELYKEEQIKLFNKMVDDHNANPKNTRKREKITDQNKSSFHLENRKNDAGRTPLTYAVVHGKKEMVIAILARRKKTLWIFGYLLFFFFCSKQKTRKGKNKEGKINIFTN